MSGLSGRHEGSQRFCVWTIPLTLVKYSRVYIVVLICGLQENKDRQKAAEAEWDAIYSELQRLLRRGVTACLRDRVSLPPQAAEKYFISGT